MKHPHSLTLTLAVFAIFILLMVQCNRSGKPKEPDKKNIVPLTKSWEKAIPHQKIPKGLASLSAEHCGSCHREIYEEWKISTHAHAYTDAQFLSEWKKDGYYVCINCHAPLQNQQEFVITGLINGDYKNPEKIANPYFDAKLQAEGINCASCHVRNGAVIGTKGSSKAPHQLTVNPNHLSEKLCLGCHQAVDTLNPMLVCTFETGNEWKNSPAKQEGKNCISCHMPEVERAIVEGYDKRKSHRHYFPGSGIPKVAGEKSMGLTGYEFKLTRNTRKRSRRDSVEYQLEIVNQHAGHRVPTGDPERFFLINFSLSDATDHRILHEKTYRIGEKWEWYPVVKKLEDNNILPGEKRIFNYSCFLPKGKKYKLKVLVTKHRINEENATFNKLPANYPSKITVYKQEELIIG